MIFLYSKFKSSIVPYYKRCSHVSMERYWPAVTTKISYCLKPNCDFSHSSCNSNFQPKKFYYSHEGERYGRYYRNGNSKEHYGKRYNENKWRRSKEHQSSYYKYLIILPAFAIGCMKIIESSDDAQFKDNFIHNNKEIAAMNHSLVPNFTSSSDRPMENENENISNDGVNSESKIFFTKNENEVAQNTIYQTLPMKSKKNIKTPLPKLGRNSAISATKILVNRKIIENGAPGISIAVAINGTPTWSAGFGYADVENSIKMGPDSVIRIASISKSITMAGVGKLIDEGKLDLDAPIQKYVPYFPAKYVDGEEVTITTRHLLSHTSGIRHYSLKEEINLKSKKNNSRKNKNNCNYNENKENDKENKNKENRSIKSKKEHKLGSLKKENVSSTEIEKDFKIVIKEKRDKIKKLLSDKMFKEENDCNKQDKSEFDLQEYYIKEHFNSVKEALELFKNDDLLFKPGEGYSYTTHGYTLVSAVIEGASKTSFTEFLKDLFKEMGLNKTYLDVNNVIIYKRARHYLRKKGLLKNVPYVDNSYKWAGGGILSTVEDLAKFGNILLYSYQMEEDNVSQRGFLKRSTMEEMWKPVPNTKMGWDKHGSYALGWAVVDMEEEPAKYCDYRRFYISHTGGAVGASSVLLILPLESEVEYLQKPSAEGVVVAIISNMQNFAGLNALALEVAKIFSRVEYKP